MFASGSSVVSSILVAARTGGARIGRGALAGALAGLLVAGPVLRIFMFVVRTTSPDVVIGATSDDGFTIGRFTTDTITFIVQIGVLSAIVGAVYAAVRLVLARRIGAPLFTIAMVGGGSGALIRDDGIDFVLLGPLIVTAGGLVVAGAIGCAAIVIAVELALRGTSPARADARAIPPAARVLSPFVATALMAIAAAGAIHAVRVVTTLIELRRGLP